MKLAEALILQTNLQQKIAYSKQQLTILMQVQDGERPKEDPQKFIKELEISFSRLAEITQKINHTNSRTGLGSMTLAEALIEIDMLSLKCQVYDDIFQAASVHLEPHQTSDFYMNSLKISELQRKIEILSSQHRDLESKIKEITWKIDLLER